MAVNKHFERLAKKITVWDLLTKMEDSVLSWFTDENLEEGYKDNPQLIAFLIDALIPPAIEVGFKPAKRMLAEFLEEKLEALKNEQD